MAKSLLKSHVSILSEMTEMIEAKLSCAVISNIEDIYIKEKEEVIRTLTINRGTDYHTISFNWYGIIDSISKKFPSHIIIDVHNAICGGYLRSICDEIEAGKLAQLDFDKQR